MDYEPRQRHHPNWQPFTYFGGSSGQSPTEPTTAFNGGHSTEADASIFPLSLVRVGDRVWIVDFAAEDGILERFISMGLNRGTELDIVNRSIGGSIMVAVANTRLALGAGIVDKIYVRHSAIQHPPHPHTFSQEAGLQPLVSQPINQEKPMQTSLRLRDLAVGSQGRITGYAQGSASYRQKLLAMGLTPGTEFTITRQAPLGDPVELRIRGFQLSLRKVEADALVVEAIDHA